MDDGRMKRLIVCLIVFFPAFFATSAPAWEPSVSSGATVIAGATLIDSTFRAPIRNSVIVIAGSRISHVGTMDDPDVPEGAEIVDATGKYVIPGLADMHNHLAPGSFGFGRGTSDNRRYLAELLGWGITLVFSPRHQRSGRVC